MIYMTLLTLFALMMAAIIGYDIGKIVEKRKNKAV